MKRVRSSAHHQIAAAREHYGPEGTLYASDRYGPYSLLVLVKYEPVFGDFPTAVLVGGIWSRHLRCHGRDWVDVQRIFF